MKVLIAEDDLVSQRILSNYLQKWGYERTVVSDGAEAWRLLQEEDFPLVISDWLMPQMDGLELIRRIHASPRLGGHVYTILLTAKSQKEDLVEAMEAGADDFLAKPFDRDELRVRLREGERTVRVARRIANHVDAIVDGLAEELSRVEAIRNQFATADERAAGLLNELQTGVSRMQETARMLQDVVRRQNDEC